MKKIRLHLGISLLAYMMWGAAWVLPFTELSKKIGIVYYMALIISITLLFTVVAFTSLQKVKDSIR